MKLQSKKRTFLASFLILFLIPSHSAEFEINFIETFDEYYMLEVLQELKYENNINRIKNRIKKPAKKVLFLLCNFIH